MSYRIDYNTGAGNVEGIATLEEAKELAVDGMAYTQENVDIMDEETGEVVTRSQWIGVKKEEDNEALATFGDYGYYSDWYRIESI